MTQYLIRGFIGMIGVFTAIFAVAFYVQAPLVQDIWPWTGYYAQLSSLSFYFLSSIALAIAAPVLWIALSNRLHAVVPGTINLLVSFVGIGILMFQGYLADSQNTRLLVGAVLMFVGVIVNISLLWVGQRQVARDTVPLPRMVRFSFAFFTIALILVGTGLVLKVPNILPWDTSVEASVVYGWIFLGASTYFLYGIVKPSWENATGQLIGFLAYDVVLIVPFINEFSRVKPQYQLSLTVYTAVVIFSGLLAIYYLLVNRSTRLFDGKPTS